jgi:hypothetical protein
VVTTVGMNKSGDIVVVRDGAVIRTRAMRGSEFTRKDTGVGLDYRPLHSGLREVRRTQPVG